MFSTGSDKQIEHNGLTKYKRIRARTTRTRRKKEEGQKKMNTRTDESGKKRVREGELRTEKMKKEIDSEIHECIAIERGEKGG